MVPCLLCPLTLVPNPTAESNGRYKAMMVKDGALEPCAESDQLGVFARRSTLGGAFSSIRGESFMRKSVVR